MGASEGAARVRGEHSAVRTAHADLLVRGVRRDCGESGEQPKAKTAEKLFATLDGLFAELGGSVISCADINNSSIVKGGAYKDILILLNERRQRHCCHYSDYAKSD